MTPAVIDVYSTDLASISYKVGRNRMHIRGMYFFFSRCRIKKINGYAVFWAVRLYLAYNKKRLYCIGIYCVADSNPCSYCYVVLCLYIARKYIE